jgi:hypothetical protein
MSHGKNADFMYLLYILYKLYIQQYIITVHKTTIQSVIYLQIHTQHGLTLKDHVQGNTVITTMEHHWNF